MRIKPDQGYSAEPIRRAARSQTAGMRRAQPRRRTPPGRRAPRRGRRHDQRRRRRATGQRRQQRAIVAIQVMAACRDAAIVSRTLDTKRTNRHRRPARFGPGQRPLPGYRSTRIGPSAEYVRYHRTNGRRSATPPTTTPPATPATPATATATGLAAMTRLISQMQCRTARGRCTMMRQSRCARAPASCFKPAHDPDPTSTAAPCDRKPVTANAAARSTHRRPANRRHCDLGDGNGRPAAVGGSRG